jgi:hypothetical protein
MPALALSVYGHSASAAYWTAMRLSIIALTITSSPLRAVVASLCDPLWSVVPG